MARRTNAGPLVASIVMLLILGGLAACMFPPPSTEEPQKTYALQTPGLGTINVTVIDNVGRRMTGATVRLNGTAQNFTDDNGTCSLNDLAPNVTYSISASKPNYLDTETKYELVAENETKNITLTLWGGWVNGRVLGLMGAIPGANVTVVGLGYTTDASPTDGWYEIRGVPGGTLTVLASAPGYVSDSEFVDLPIAGVGYANFTLVTQNGSISGSTFHASLGTPLNGTDVSVQIGQRTVTVQSDSEGNYVITDVPEGNYTVTATKTGFFPEAYPNVEVVRGQIRSRIDFNLTERPTRLFGVVRSGQVLLVGANISILGTEIHTQSGADGNYEIGNLTAGTYVVSATVQGYETQTFTNVEILPGSDTQLNFNMTGLPGARLRGTVKDSRTAEPIANVLVTIVDLEPQPRSVFTDINGEFEFPALPADNYTLRFEKSGYSPLEITKVKVVEGSLDVIEFQMTPLRDTFEGFIKGLDMAHSMMIVALALTFIILGVAIFLRIRMIVSPSTAPAVYDQAEEGKKPEEGGEAVAEGESPSEEPTAPDPELASKKTRKLK